MTSYDIARDLKTAGFPQPAPKSGQFWYDSYRNLSVLSVYDPGNGAASKIMVLILDAEDTYETILTEISGFVYAPTAPEILQAIEELSGRHWFTLKFYQMFECAEYEFRGGCTREMCDENPADACALMYLSVLRATGKNSW